MLYLYYICRERGVRVLEERLSVKGAVERVASGPQGLPAILADDTASENV